MDKAFKFIGSFFALAIYFTPIFLISIYSLFHYVVTKNDFTRTKFVQTIIRPLCWVEDNWIKDIRR